LSNELEIHRGQMNFGSAKGEYLIPDRVLIDMEEVDFYNFRDKLQAEAQVRNLDLIISSHPDGVLIQWSPAEQEALED
jgi:hypothetical protein